MIDDEVKLSFRSRLDIIDITDNKDRKIIISAIIPNEKIAINTTITHDGIENDRHR